MAEYIDRDALLAEAKRISGPMTGDGWDNWGVYALINRQPAADVRPVVRGRWLHKETTDNFHVVGQCSVCKERKRIDNFCPNCGADMRGKT